jgi:hypothetical protein
MMPKVTNELKIALAFIARLLSGFLPPFFFPCSVYPVWPGQNIIQITKVDPHGDPKDICPTCSWPIHIEALKALKSVGECNPVDIPRWRCRLSLNQKERGRIGNRYPLSAGKHPGKRGVL